MGLFVVYVQALVVAVSCATALWGVSIPLHNVAIIGSSPARSVVLTRHIPLNIIVLVCGLFAVVYVIERTD